MDRFLYLLAATLVNGIRVLPLLVCFRLGQLLGFLVYIGLPHYRKLSQKNLTIAFGETYSLAQIKKMARNNFLLLGANLLCSIKIPTLSDDEIRSLITIENKEEWERSIIPDNGRGTVVALSHFGNWEINAQIATFVRPRQAGAIYQRLRNQAMDNLINRDRRTRGVATFDRKRDLSAATTLLRTGGLLGILIDQHAGDVGTWIPFFKKLASTSPLAATLAQKTGARLIQVTIHTTGVARWSVRIQPPTETEGRSIAEITYDLGTQLEAEIRRSPADWFWVHNRWKLPSPNFLLSRVKRGISVPEGMALQPLQLLVRSPNWLGDACMTVPAIRSLKKARPDLRLTILTPAKLAGLWEALPEIDAVIAIPSKMSPWNVAKLLRSHASHPYRPAFDAALLFPNSFRSALEVFLAKIPRRIGRIDKKNAYRRWLINQPCPKNLFSQHRHQADEYRALAEWLGAPSTQEQEAVVSGKEASTTRSTPLRIGLCPGAEYGPAKRWPIDRYRTVMKEISSKQEVTWVLIGTAAETALGSALEENFSGSLENKIGKTSLKELITLIQGLDLLLTNDTGSMHLAALFGIPTVAIFGSTDPTLTGPQGAAQHVVQHPVSCSPCFLRTCPIDFCCMTQITPQEVTEIILKQLA